jgi:hypothetical protein
MKVSCRLHAQAALPREKSHRYPLDRRLDGPPSRYGRCVGSRENITLLGIEPGLSSPQAVAIPTELQLCCTKFTEFLWTFSSVLYSKKHDVSETGSVSVLR